MLMQICENQKLIKKDIGVGMVKTGCGHSGLATLKLAVSEEAIFGINWFLYIDTRSGKLKVSLIIFGWKWSKTGVAL